MTSRPVFIGMSTKMYLGREQTIAWLDGLARALDERRSLAAERTGSTGSTVSTVVPFVIPSFPLIEAAVDRLASRGALVGAQTSGWADGPYTGEVSPSLLAECGVELVEVGHAERRSQFGEDDAMVARKTAAILAAGLTPLLCIGESDRTDVAGAIACCLDQIEAALEGSVEGVERVILAYEPVWAIGAAQPADAVHVNGVVSGLREVLTAGSGLQSGDVRIVYGGSAAPGILEGLPAVDGLFLGRFAHDVREFVRALDEAALRRRGSTDAEQKPTQLS